MLIIEALGEAKLFFGGERGSEESIIERKGRKPEDTGVLETLEE